MTRAEAVRQIQQLFERAGQQSEGLNAQGEGGVSLRGGECFFRHEPETGRLRCSALVYRFHGVPRPEVVAAFEDEARQADPAAGAPEYDASARAFFVTRRFTDALPPERFQAELFALIDLSLVWAREKMAKVAERAQAAMPKTHPRDPYGTA